MLSIRFTASLAATAFGLLTAVSVAAAPVTWTLDNVRLADGATASGFFENDSQGTFELTRFDVKVTRGMLPAIDYTSRNASATSEVLCEFEHGGECFGPYQRVSFFAGTTLPFVSFYTNPLPNVAGGVSLTGRISGESFRHLVTAGTIAAGTTSSTWSLRGVQFEDGATATGFFQFSWALYV